MPGGAGPVQGLLTRLAGQAICAALATARMQPPLSCSVLTVDVCCACSLWMFVHTAQHGAVASIYAWMRFGSRLRQRVGKLAESTSVARRRPLCLLWTARASSRAAGRRSVGALTDRALAFRL